MARVGSIQVADQTFTVSQAAAPCTFALSAAQASFSAAAGQGNFSVTAAFADCSWTAGSTNEWIHATASTNAGPGDVLFLVDTNASIVARVGCIQVADQAFTVSQAAAPCAFALSLAETNIRAAALSAGFSIVASFPGCSWIASTTNDWLHVALTNNGSGDVAFGVDTNASIVARVGSIQVADQTFTVSQAAAPCTFTLSLAATNMTAAEMLASFSVTASFPECAWTASTTNDWLHVAPTGSGSGDVTYLVDTNASIVARVGSIQVADQTFTITQAEAPCTYTVTFAETQFSAAAASGSFTVDTPFWGCAWTIANTNAWIHTIVAGTGSNMVVFTVETNASPTVRSGSIQVADQTFTVSQAAAPCAFALSSAQASFSAAAGQSSFSVTSAFADCSWTADSTNEWIHPTATTNAGPGDVAFLVDTNASIVARVGYIQVADQTFTVSQAAAPCVFTLSIATESSNVVLSWPTSLATLTLESTTNLGPGSLWAAVTNTPEFANGFTRVTIVPTETQQFFRLHQQ
jgi:hypothetical protein